MHDPNDDRRLGRRGFFAWLAGAAAVLLGPSAPEPRRRERPLREADFYKKHDLAG